MGPADGPTSAPVVSLSCTVSFQAASRTLNCSLNDIVRVSNNLIEDRTISYERHIAKSHLV